MKTITLTVSDDATITVDGKEYASKGMNAKTPERVLWTPTCRECGISLDKENIVRYDTTFAVCKRCETETAAEWQDTKKMLKEQGFDPDNCTFIEDVLAKN